MSSTSGSAKCCSPNSDGTCTLTKICKLETPQGVVDCLCKCTCKTSEKCEDICKCNCKCSMETAEAVETSEGIKYQCSCSCVCKGNCTKNEDGSCILVKMCKITTPEGEKDCECLCTYQPSSGNCEDCLCNCECTYEKAKKVQTPEGEKYQCACVCSFLK